MLGIMTVLADPCPAYLKRGSIISGMIFIPRSRAAGMTISRMSLPSISGSVARKFRIKVLA